jgi:aryl-alcohol dehydrogenase-like predicted oxidoreductase
MSATSIPTRKLGKDGPSVPALGFGLMGLSMVYGTAPSDEERFAVLDRAVELGATFWDTSEYGCNIQHLSEDLANAVVQL